MSSVVIEEEYFSIVWSKSKMSNSELLIALLKQYKRNYEILSDNIPEYHG